jgi:hypothetical protein
MPQAVREAQGSFDAAAAADVSSYAARTTDKPEAANSIELRIAEISQLFDSLDPFPFRAAASTQLLGASCIIVGDDNKERLDLVKKAG